MKKFLFVSGFLFVILSIFLVPRTIKVRIDCKTQYGTCPKELYSKLTSLNGKSLPSAKKEALKILSSDFIVSDFSTQYKLPNILSINIVIKKAVFGVKDESTSKVYLTDREGKILSITDSSSLPEVSVVLGDRALGDVLESEILFALGLQEGVYNMYQVRTGRVWASTLLVELPASVKVIFPLRGDRDVLLGSLRLIYAKLQTEAEAGKYSEIDLRFKNPVLR